MAWDRKAAWCGNRLITYPDRYTIDALTRQGFTVEWRDADKPFDARMYFDGFGRGRSSAVALFVDHNTRESFSMFLTDLEKVIRNDEFSTGGGGMLEGEFVVKKRGANFGIAFVQTKMVDLIEIPNDTMNVEVEVGC